LYSRCYPDRSKFYKEAAVSYIKAEEILPEELIRQIQEYADGVYIYIPRKPGTRHAWGQGTYYKAELKARNDRIRSDYASGASVMDPSRKFHLSEKSIHRILQKS
jgi:Mor family transcriptional regulator